MLINVKMPTVVSIYELAIIGILTFISLIETKSERLNGKKISTLVFTSSQVSSACKKLNNLWTWFYYFIPNYFDKLYINNHAHSEGQDNLL